MICPQKEELLNQFIDGELDLSNQVDLFKHLAECSECRAFVDAAVRMREIRRKEQIPFPPDIDERVFSHLPQTRVMVRSQRGPATVSPGFWRRRFAVPLPLAAAFLAITIFFGVMIGRLLVLNSGEKGSAEEKLSATARPATVIMIYSVPPVEIVGNASVKKINHTEQINY